MLVGSLPGYQSTVRKTSVYWGNTADIAVCLVVLFSCIYLILHGKSDPAADARVTVAALIAGKHTGPAWTVPTSCETRVALGWDEAPADTLVSRGCENPNHATAILRRGFLWPGSVHFGISAESAEIQIYAEVHGHTEAYCSEAVCQNWHSRAAALLCPALLAAFEVQILTKNACQPARYS